MSAWTFISTQQIAGNTLLQIVGFFTVILVALVAGRIGRVFVAAKLSEKRFVIGLIKILNSIGACLFRIT